MSGTVRRVPGLSITAKPISIAFDHYKSLWSFSFPAETVPRLSKSSAVVKIPSILQCIRMPGRLASVARAQKRGGWYSRRALKSVHLMILHMYILKPFVTGIAESAAAA